MPLSLLMALTLFMALSIPAVIKVSIAIPPMVVLNAAAVTLPVSVVVTLPIMTRGHPAIPVVGGTSPIPLMPSVTALDGIPIAIHPNIIGTRSHRPNSNYARRRWWANPDSKIYLARECQSHSQQRQGKNFLYHKFNSY